MTKKTKNQEVFERDTKTVRYFVELTGVTPLLMHSDNITFTEDVNAWRKDPANKKVSVAGDDRSPAWSWAGYLYAEQGKIVMPADNIMTMMREAGAKVPTGKARETYKLRASYGLQLSTLYFDFFCNGAEISTDWINALVGVSEFEKHEEAVKDHGFRLFLKRAKIGAGPRASKHVRVRPMFENWKIAGEIAVIDESESGLTADILLRILQIGGQQIGLCDWRPSCSSAGSYGKFNVTQFDIVG
ncbi:MAG: hypothetical protein IJU76_15395 [Desulfovibrionaceae bacterium]|nr:hypothetical protein [Desulfovibrionaceae bacterium]